MTVNIQHETAEVFRYFKEICAIPHGSGNMKAISDYCLGFARKNNLKAVRDRAENVVIYKPGTMGYESSPPIILQGHLDMVCQKIQESKIDFEKDGLEVYTDGDFIKAKGTTLGADNGIAVSMIMAILASKELAHPPIEAVFTTDEEIGMLGAEALDASLLTGRKMINLDSEEAEILTVSCAGGSDFNLFLPFSKVASKGRKISLEISDLKGGHSGVDIDKGRINANMLMARILNFVGKTVSFNLVGINGGTKGNAIPFCSKAEIVTKDSEGFIKTVEDCFSVIKKEISHREKACSLGLTAEADGEFEVLDPAVQDRLIYLLLTTPNGVIDMSSEIEGLVETSLNLGILTTGKDEIAMQYALRSNKASALSFLEDRMAAFASHNGCRFEFSGRYEPWEFKNDSPLQKLYADAFCREFGHKPQVAAIHAGLECAVFAKKIKDLDCISIGPDMFDVHTTNERLSISSANRIFRLLCSLLSQCK